MARAKTPSGVGLGFVELGLGGGVVLELLEEVDEHADGVGGLLGAGEGGGLEHAGLAIGLEGGAGAVGEAFVGAELHVDAGVEAAAEDLVGHDEGEVIGDGAGRRRGRRRSGSGRRWACRR